MSFKIGLAQYPIQFHKNQQAWLLELETWFQKAKQQELQVLVFPEYGSMDLTSLLTTDDQTDLALQLNQLQQLHDFFLDSYIRYSKKYQTYTVAPSFPVLIGAKYFNRAYFISPSGQYDFQDKIHMTRFENEEWHISESETELKVFETALGSFGIQICFDIEFPWATSLLASQGAQMILVPSCTEGVGGMNRVHTGAKARALENQIYTAISQTVGDALWSPAVDKNTGIAAVYTTSDRNFPDDGVLAYGELNKSCWITAEIDLEKIKEVRTKGQVFNYQATSKYPWAKTEQKNLILKNIVLK